LPQLALHVRARRATRVVHTSGPARSGWRRCLWPPGRDNSFSALGGWNFYLNAASSAEEKDAAYEFVKFATAPEQQRFRALNGSFLPTLKDLYGDEEIVEKVPVIALGEAAIKNARPRPLSPYYSDMSLVMAEQFNASVKGTKSPEEAASTLDRELQEIVDLGETS
jgi:multiple sugar transport system substrate-binding protein